MVLILLFVVFIRAVPIISAVNGAIEHGSDVDIVGSGFGNKASATPLHFLDFNSGTEGATLDEGLPLSYATQAQCYPHYTLEHSRDGSKSARFCGETGPGYQYQLLGTNHMNLQGSTRIYIHGWLWWWWGTAPLGASDTLQIKAWRLTSADGTHLSPYPVVMEQHSKVACDGIDNCYAIRAEHRELNCPTNTPRDKTLYHGQFRNEQWNSFAIVFDMGVPGRNGSLRYYINEVEQGNPPEKWHNHQWVCEGDGLIDNFLIGNYFAKAVPGHRNYLQYDDVYVDNSWQRVEIGDASVYSSCTVREIAVASHWTESLVRVRLNIGASFTPSQRAYIFIVDENNIASNGFEIVWGGTAAPPTPTLPPTVPPPSPPIAPPSPTPPPTTSPPPPPTSSPPSIMQCKHYAFDTNNSMDGTTMVGDAMIDTSLAMVGVASLSVGSSSGGGHVDAGDWGGGSNRFSLCCWIRVIQWKTSDARIISKAHGYNDQDHVFMLSGFSNGVIRARLSIEGEETAVIIGNAVLDLSVWHHIGMVYDGQQVTLYINGSVQGAEVDFSSGNVVENTDRVIIGAHSQSPFDKNFDGNIDDLIVCNGVLNMDDIYRNGYSLPPSTATPTTRPSPTSSPFSNFTITTTKTTTSIAFAQSEEERLSSSARTAIIVGAVAFVCILLCACFIIQLCRLYNSHRSLRRSSGARRKRHSSTTARASSNFFVARRSRQNTGTTAYQVK